MRTLLAAVAVLLAAAAPALAGPAVESHDLTVRLAPAQARLEAEDKLVLRRDGGGAFTFALQRGLEIASATLDGQEVRLVAGEDDGWRVLRTVEVPAAGAERCVLALTYAGRIADTIAAGGPQSIVHDRTRGLIAPEGVYLSEGSYWYPTDGATARFDVRTHPVAGWEVVTQGTRTAPAAEGGPTVWRGKYPADGLTLVAGPWQAKRRKVGDVEIGTYLTARNAEHADALLDLTAGYLRKYGALLGPYAYDRFDIVDNFFTTGYGMPEYTLLGSDVIGRIVADLKRRGSVPAGYLGHEIVHCWWGNLVFPDYASGNWCEALTTYCSNYIEKEEEGAAAAAEHRRVTALRFTLRVHGTGKDYPVRAFAEKREAADDDIGYGKGSMFFHALRRDVGDEAFWETLRRVAREQRGRRIGWADWQREFETSARRSLAEQFAQGLDRTGAPLLELKDTKVTAAAGRVLVSGTLRQVLAKGEEPWRVTVPVVVEHVGGSEEALVDLVSAESSFSVAVPSMPVRIAADPHHHVFRVLGPEEVPACFAATESRKSVVVVVPDGDEALLGVGRMAAGGPGRRLVTASQAPKVPEAGTSYVVFGDETRVPLLAALREKLPRHFPPAGSKPETTVVLASSRNPADEQEFVTTMVGTPGALAARARFAFYYRFDGRVLFDGPVPKDRSLGPVPSRTARLLLPDLRAATSPERAAAVVAKLAAPEMKGRLAGSAEDAAARRFVADELRLAGVEPDEMPFSFAVKRIDPAATVLTRVSADGAVPVEGVPLVASPETPAGGLRVVGSVADGDPDVAGRALVVDLGTGTEDPLAFLRDAAKLAVARRAAALLVRVPKDAPRAMAELWEFPERLHPEVAERLSKSAERGGHGNALIRAAGTAARIGSDAELPLPTVAVPADFVPAKDEALQLSVKFDRAEVRTANVVGRVRSRASGGGAPGRSVVLGAHLDHLGEGFPGADDNASGVAALLEAVNVLSAHADLLASDVTVVFFGAEEWGLRGSRAFVAQAPKGSVTAMLNADTVGRRGVDGVCVVGITVHPALGRVVAAAVEQCHLDLGREIDQRAYAHGSDHWPFHQAGVPAVDLWSGDYLVMDTRADTVEGVDPAKVARVGRAMALAALAAAGAR